MCVKPPVLPRLDLSKSVSASAIPTCSSYTLPVLLLTCYHSPSACCWAGRRGALEGSLGRLRSVKEVRGLSDPNPELPTVLHIVCCFPAPGNMSCPLCFSAQACESAPEQLCPAGSTHCYSGVLSLQGGKPGLGDSGGLNMVSLKECGASLPELG